MYQLLPKEHLIITELKDYNLNYLDTPISKYRELIHNELKKIFVDSNEFEIQRTVPTQTHVNWRYPLMQSYFIRDIIKNKSVMHIGSSTLEHDEGMSKYASSIYSIEILNIKPCKDRQFHCKHNFKRGDIFKDKNPQKVDVYLFWCGYNIDSRILDHLVSHDCKGTFLIGVPQQEDKLIVFLNLIKQWLNSNIYKSVSYVTIPFDESDNYQDKYILKNKNSTYFPQFPIKRKTPFTNVKSNEWTNVHTFDNQCGVMVLLRIDV